MLDTAVGLDVGSNLKSAINTLLAALCRHTPSLYSIVMATVLSSTRQDHEEAGRLLHTIAHVSLSDECMDDLLASNLILSVISDINSTLETLLKTSSTSSSFACRPALASLCVHLSFLTDLCLGHGAVQRFLTSPECSHIWHPLLKLLSERRDSIDASDVEWSFCQEVAVQFFSACIRCCLVGKQLFISLLSKALCLPTNKTDASNENEGEEKEEGEEEDYSDEDKEEEKPRRDLKSSEENEEDTLCLTPFILKLLLDLVLSMETVPVVVSLHPSITTTSMKSAATSSSFSLTPTHSSPSFHPSHPVGTNCHHLTVPVDTSLESLALLFRRDEPQKQVEKPQEQAKPKKVSHYSSYTSILFGSPHQPPPPPPVPSSGSHSSAQPKKKLHDFDVLEFDLSSWKWQESSTQSNRTKLNMIFVSSTSRHPRMYFPMHSLVGQITTAHSTSGCCHTTRMLSLRRSAGVGDVVVGDTSSDMVSLLEVFTQVGGVRNLALLLPLLYKSQWPPQYVNSACQTKSTIALSSDKLPLFLPPNSFVMLTLCLQLNGYAELLVTNISLARLLLRGLLGAVLKGKRVCLIVPLCVCVCVYVCVCVCLLDFV